MNWRSLSYQSNGLVRTITIVITQAIVPKSCGAEPVYPVVEGDVDSGIAESDDVGVAVFVDIKHCARVVFDAPSTSVIAKARIDSQWTRKARPVIPGNICSGISKIDDFRTTVLIEISLIRQLCTVLDSVTIGVYPVIRHSNASVVVNVTSNGLEIDQVTCRDT